MILKITKMMIMKILTYYIILYFFQVCKAIKEELTPRFINIPRGQRLQEVLDGFEDRGFPQCVGAIDGTHIPIIAPTKDPADFYNRKGWHSIIVQAVCDHEYRYVTVP